MQSPARFAALVLALAAAPLAAQNATAPAAPPAGPVQPPGTAPAPGVTPPAVQPLPPDSPSAPVNNSAAAAPPPAPAPVPEPVTIDPDAAYPNGFADPADPFANELADARRERSGFPWGLLGLLGLLGLVPLFRRGSKTRTVYVDRNDPKRVLREEVEE
ncbi:hypothetical protein [Sphingosinicella sp.]|uniref:hypothetical protein n=1 Tax=Sphingosinicella sp. TaxID=1917971 RepID=UPI004037BA10